MNSIQKHKLIFTLNRSSSGGTRNSFNSIRNLTLHDSNVSIRTKRNNRSNSLLFNSSNGTRRNILDIVLRTLHVVHQRLSNFSSFTIVTKETDRATNMTSHFLYILCTSFSTSRTTSAPKLSRLTTFEPTPNLLDLSGSGCRTTDDTGNSSGLLEIGGDLGILLDMFGHLRNIGIF